MKKTILLLLSILLSEYSYSQVSSSFIVQGDIDKFYPVTFYDGGWASNVPTELKLGRSNIHQDTTWRGSLMASFRYHVTGWGHGSNFINADIVPPNAGQSTQFVAGYKDATSAGTCRCIIIWLKGGGTTYYYQSNYAVNHVVYDGIQNPLPYNEVNGPAHTFKSIPDVNISSTGIIQDRNMYFMSKVGIGTTIPDEKLTVKGKIHTQEVRVDMAGPLVPDYVFAEDYKLKTLQEVENYIKVNKHLPEIPSAQEIEKSGLMLAEMNMSLLKKVEELTLYVIEQNKKLNAQSKEIGNFRNVVERLSKIEEKLEIKR